MLLIFFLYTALLGIAAVIYRSFLAYEEVLNWWFTFGSRYEGKWFYKPIWGCVYCISGQLAAWSYIFSWIGLRYVAPDLGLSNYSLLGLFIFICVTIFYTHIFDKIYNHYFN